MKIILISNYPKDRQESMIRFSEMLLAGFRDAGFEAETWNPVVILGKFFASTTMGIGKWMGYIDKWMIFPVLLKLRLLKKKNKHTGDRYYICDHSNAPYLKYLPQNRTSITCHDVLAIRGALGHADAYCPASKTGKIFQQWIFKNLQRARLLAAVSQKTLDQLQELTNGEMGHKEWRVIYNTFNNDFGPIDKTLAEKLLHHLPLQPDTPFLLHVGSDSPRKNRKLLLDMVALLGSAWDGIICFAGDALEETLVAHAEKLGLRDRYISVVKPNHKTLQALYCSCAAFVFPSFSEGFGWPLIEAQACGAPVIASNIEPMPEISGGAALYADPANARAFADALLGLMHQGNRTQLIQSGFKNCLRFQPGKIIDNYLNLHGLQRIKL